MAKRRRYKLLNFVRRWYIFLGLLTCLGGTIFAGLMVISSKGNPFAILIGCGYFVGSIATGISLAAIGECIELAMDLEDSARQTQEVSLVMREKLSEISEQGDELCETAKQCQAWLAKIGSAD